jgi:YHS domain-containing protein
MRKIAVLSFILTMGIFLNAYANDAKLVEVNNKICPVSHEEVGKEGMKPFKVTYNGKIYNLCCSMCEKDFKKDPAKYSKIMDEEVAAQEAASKKM